MALPTSSFLLSAVASTAYPRKWIAYCLNESGRFEVYVQPFPGPGGKTQVSINGGAQPRWRADGQELFYVGLDSRLMAAPIHVAKWTGRRPEQGYAVRRMIPSRGVVFLFLFNHCLSTEPFS